MGHNDVRELRCLLYTFMALMAAQCVRNLHDVFYLHCKIIFFKSSHKVVLKMYLLFNRFVLVYLSYQKVTNGLSTTDSQLSQFN